MAFPLTGFHVDSLLQSFLAQDGTAKPMLFTSELNEHI